MKPLVKAVLYIAFVWLAVTSLQRVRKESARPSANERRMALVDDARDRESGGATAGEAGNRTNDVGEAQASLGMAATNAAGSLTNLEAAGSPGPSSSTARSKDRGSALGLWIAVFVVALLGLAGLAGWDFTQWFASRANRALGVEVEGPKEKALEYELAEQEWAKGNHLDAITMMREYLAKNPGEQYVALRIAEIYEKDLGNYLAAALEYEEVLNQKLPREKWGWTALRLSNLYSGRLNQPDRAIGVLKRVMDDYPETAAAKKARERMGVPEPTAEPVGEMDVNPIGATPDSPDSDDGDSSSLPSGFRRKK